MDIHEEEKLKTEAIENLQKSFLQLNNIDNFDIKIDDRQGSHYMEAIYRDGTDGEEVWVDVEINRWGVIKYNCTIVEWFNQNEIVTPESCHDCYEDCHFYRKSGECGITEKHIVREVQKWLSASDGSSP